MPKKHVDSLTQRTWKNEMNEKVIATQSSEKAGGTSYGQTSCSICLEDYEHDQTQVRELPCRHIFHPDCIDPFLLKRSSLCPLCKQSVLPKGYIPPDSQLTAATVMRERRRRRQARRTRNTSRNIELQASEISPAPVADLENLAPDNEEEERQLRNRGMLSRGWTALFPSRNV